MLLPSGQACPVKETNQTNQTRSDYRTPLSRLIVQFQIKIRKLCRHRSRFPKYVELSHFTFLLFCRVRQRIVQRFIIYVFFFAISIFIFIITITINLYYFFCITFFVPLVFCYNMWSLTLLHYILWLLL